MKQVNGFNTWIFTGAESKQLTFRGEPVAAEGWYLGGEAGSNIEAGPFRDERRALLEHEAMSNTSGT